MKVAAKKKIYFKKTMSYKGWYDTQIKMISLLIHLSIIRGQNSREQRNNSIPLSFCFKGKRKMRTNCTADAAPSLVWL